MELRTFKTRAEMNKAHEKDIADFPFVWAFTNEQMEQGMKEKWGLDFHKKAHLKLIASIGAGGYIRKEDSKAMHEMFERQTAEKKQFAKDFKQLVGIIKAEMANHEYWYTLDSTDTLNALTPYIDNPRFAEAWKKAQKEYMKEAEEANNPSEEVV